MSSPAPLRRVDSERPPAPPAGVDGVRAGDGPALDAWIRVEHPRVHRLCLGFLADATEAEDVAQEALLRLLDRLDEAAEVRDYRAWSSTLVLNLCRDRLRRRSARSAAEERAGELRAPLPVPDPADELARRETQAALVAMLDRLSPREREVFVLRDLEERPTTEVARVLGVGESTVRTLLSLARERLRRVLGPRLQAEGHGG